MTRSQTLVVRADASVAIGTGHVMRCLALAQAWQDGGGEVVFAMTQSTPAIDERLQSERVEIVRLKTASGSAQDAAQVAELAHNCHANWVVVDGYEFDSEYQRSLKNAGLKLLFVDDNGHATHYFADLVLNQNVHATEDFYRGREGYTRLLLGPHYTMLRREFWPWREWKREIAPVGNKVLVTMGGSDPDNVTDHVIGALRQVEVSGLEATIVVGGSNPHTEYLEKATGQIGATRLLKNPSNMPELMAWADVAVSGAGTTCLEMCLLGLPAILIDVAANQTPVAEALEQKGIAIHLGSSEEVEPEAIAGELKSLLSSDSARFAMCQRAQQLVDGRGAERVAATIRNQRLRLRRVEETDCRLLWEWANDPVVRAASFSPAPILFERHQEWFAAKMNNRNCLMFIGESGDGRPIGQFRVEWSPEHEGEVGVSVAADSRGAGYSSILIDLGVREVFATTSAQRVHAFIRPGNRASIRAFEHASFTKVSEDQVNGHLAVHYVRRRGNQQA